MHPCVCMCHVCAAWTGLCVCALLFLPDIARRLPIMYSNTFNEMLESKTTPGSWLYSQCRSPLGMCHSRLAALAAFNEGGEHKWGVGAGKTGEKGAHERVPQEGVRGKWAGALVSRDLITRQKSQARPNLAWLTPPFMNKCICCWV